MVKCTPPSLKMPCSGMKAMNRSKVSIVRANDYDRAQLCSAVETSLDLIGGLETIVEPGSKVFVKINHLSPPSEAEKGIVTHPVFVEAVLELLKRAGAEITVGDDIDSDTGDGFQISGFRQMCDKAGVRLINLRETGFVETSCQGHLLNKVYFSSTVLDADVIINLPKLKTHSLTIFTGGIKNMFGAIPQGLRTGFHAEYARNEAFAQVLTDVFSTAIPHLTIMDGIIAMEGEGPANGKLRKVGVVLASRDAVALDAVATRIVGGNPMDIYTTRYSDERGLGVGNLEDIEVVGERLEDVAVPDFKLPSSAFALLRGRVPGFLRRFLQGQLTVKPWVIERQCTLCLACENICPTGAITMSGETVEIDHDVCIGCMCCHEVCRFDAIRPRRPVIGRLIYFFANVLGKQ